MVCYDTFYFVFQLTSIKFILMRKKNSLQPVFFPRWRKAVCTWLIRQSGTLVNFIHIEVRISNPRKLVNTGMGHLRIHQFTWVALTWGLTHLHTSQRHFFTKWCPVQSGFIWSQHHTELYILTLALGAKMIIIPVLYVVVYCEGYTVKTKKKDIKEFNYGDSIYFICSV